jgi:hypothetical protein
VIKIKTYIIIYNLLCETHYGVDVQLRHGSDKLQMRSNLLSIKANKLEGINTIKT